tara:strand:- start:312 stop:1250 length:939 start_codon:yes stop_codon:yes gene_type:complete
MNQITNNIMMIKPVGFRYNDQTAANNYYQTILDNLSYNQIQRKALKEFNSFVDLLKNAGVNVIVIEDTIMPETPDSIFPNNWVSFHADGSIVLYPMCAKNRREERRRDILDHLTYNYSFMINDIIDFTKFENHNKYLEGTGSMILDRENKICYACISIRTNYDLVTQFCKKFDYKPVCFTAYQDINKERKAIYHTNVMMCIAENFAVVCLESIDDLDERELVVKTLVSTNKEIIEISTNQKLRFAGNMLQVIGDKSYLVMSTSAYNILNKDQKSVINKYCSILHSPLDTIEACGGGSARCMMAEIFLPKKLI